MQDKLDRLFGRMDRVIEAIRSGKPLPTSRRSLELAERVAARQAAPFGNVDTWAERLARDVCRLTD